LKTRRIATTLEDEKSQKSKPGTVVLGLIQTRCSPDPAENFARAVERISQAARQGAQIICTQEFFRPQYFCQSENHDYFKLAEPIPGPSTAALQKLARRHKVVIIASLFEKRAAGVYHNTAAIIDADGSVARHLPQDAHSGRSALLREILLYSGRPWFSRLADAPGKSASASAGTNGIPKPPG
jgi:hypothetical protein